MNEKLAALYALQQQDSALDILKRQYALLDTGKAETAAVDAAQKARTEAQAALQAARAAVVDTELEHRTVEEKRSTVETKLYSGKVTNAKELQAMQDEVAMLVRNRERLGEKLKSLQEQVEDCRSREAAAASALAGAETAFKEKQAAFKADSEKIVAQARVLHTQRTEAAAAIAPPLLQRYETLRKNKGGLAVVPVEDGNLCGGCKMGLPFNIIKRMQIAGDIEQCDNCQRLLILTI